MESVMFTSKFKNAIDYGHMRTMATDNPVPTLFYSGSKSDASISLRVTYLRGDNIMTDWLKPKVSKQAHT